MNTGSSPKPLSSFIILVDGALGAQQCSEIILRLEADNALASGSTGYGVVPTQKVSSDLDISGRPEWRDVEQELRRSLNEGVNRYLKANESFGSLARIGCRAFRLRRYDPSEFFNWHIDCFDASVANRVLACIWYLNDVDAGGATEFLYQDVQVRPRAGRLLMFPTSFEYVHRSSPVESGSKYIALGFIEHIGGED